MPGFVSEAVPVKSAQPLPWIQAVVGYQDMYTRDTLANVSDDPKLTAETVTQIHRDDALACQRARSSRNRAELQAIATLALS